MECFQSGQSVKNRDRVVAWSDDIHEESCNFALLRAFDWPERGNAREADKRKKKLCYPNMPFFACRCCNSPYLLPHPHHPQTTMHLLSSHLFSTSRSISPLYHHPPVCQTHKCCKFCNKVYSDEPSPWYSLLYCLENNGVLKRIMGDVASARRRACRFTGLQLGEFRGAFGPNRQSW
jgi:hypothetical protein